MNIIIVISLAVLVFYVLLAIRWIICWEKSQEYLPSTAVYSHLSVVIAFRNESDNLGNLLNSLCMQEFPAGLFEVILVDDHSDDGSYELVKRMITGLPNFSCISCPENLHGKKAALKAGISAASHELIVTTDADAVAKPQWLATISNFYSENKADLIIGIVNISGKNSFLGRFTEAEFTSLVASGAGASASGHPMFCNGANLAFRKTLYYSLEDAMKESVVSGDDTFLLHAAKKAGRKIAILKSLNSVVTVKAPETMRNFMDQHIRWASKSTCYTDPDIIKTALIILMTNSLLAASFLMFMTGLNMWLFLLIFTIKSLIDYRLLNSFYTYLNKHLRKAEFLLYSLVYAFYVPATAFTALLTGFRWKGRTYKLL